ncbi:hypothetical protein CC86DRAFT_366003 [Ophiobolus disseminans]|uniref:Uncharacterized protein n=1 Tax=Ophiobolus disseminans TaxID=1469910 RepID=A0A6A7AFL9_9PLEO|nr:hypothetical protein CC86DRAFT_366003 [Ophiobolus disseminans]
MSVAVINAIPTKASTTAANSVPVEPPTATNDMLAESNAATSTAPAGFPKSAKNMVARSLTATISMLTKSLAAVNAMPAERTTPNRIPSTARINSTHASSIIHPQHDWVTMRMPLDDAVDYLEHEIQEWLMDNDEKKRAAEALPYVRWYKGGIGGVRIDRAVRYFYANAYETFAHNPYNVPAEWFFLMMLAMILFIGGNFAMGALKAMEGLRFYPLVEGILGGLIILWVLPLFLFPPLLANTREQFAAQGLPLTGM